MTTVQPLFDKRLKPRTEPLIGTYLQIENVGQRSKVKSSIHTIEYRHEQLVFSVNIRLGENMKGFRLFPPQLCTERGSKRDVIKCLTDLCTCAMRPPQVNSEDTQSVVHVRETRTNNRLGCEPMVQDPLLPQTYEGSKINAS